MEKNASNQTPETPSKQPDESFCRSCGAVIKKEAEICPHCGVRQLGASATDKSAGLAAVLSALLPGAGQIYNGQILKGIIFIVIGFVLMLTMVILIGLVLFPLFWVYNIYDAYSVAQRGK